MVKRTTISGSFFRHHLQILYQWKFQKKDEFIAGTNPTNANDYFSIDSISTETNVNAVMIYWQSATGRLYSVYTATNLLCPWTNIYSNPGNGAMLSYTNVDRTADHMFFRVGVEIE